MNKIIVVIFILVIYNLIKNVEHTEKIIEISNKINDINTKTEIFSINLN